MLDQRADGRPVTEPAARPGEDGPGLGRPLPARVADTAWQTSRQDEPAHPTDRARRGSGDGDGAAAAGNGKRPLPGEREGPCGGPSPRPEAGPVMVSRVGGTGCAAGLPRVGPRG